MLTGRITENKLQAWIDANRPEIALYETNGNYGIYRKDVGPAHGFQTLGRSWADVAAALGAVEVAERV